MDEELAAQAEERAVAEFQKYLAFALNDKRFSRTRRKRCCIWPR